MDPAVMPKLADTKALGEVKALQDFYGTSALCCVCMYL